MYQLLYNRGAGEHKVIRWSEAELDNWEESGYRTQEGHFTEYGLYETKDELEEAIQELRGRTVYAVFENRPAGEVFVSEEDNLSGNWRGSKYGNFNLVGRHNNRAAAESQAKQHRQFFASLRR